MPLYHGSCHCGAIRFDVTAEPVEVTSCDCSLCVKKNALMIKVPEHQLRLIAGADHLSLYRWNSKIAEHHFCRVCGIYTFHRKRAAPDSFGINVFCLENFDPSLLPHRRTDGRTMSREETPS
jgi:hypothetical protein